MSSFNDGRFTRVFTDPRFKPMPTFEKKSKIDKRFSALFTNEDFGHRPVVDKRGRPIHDVAKRGKHTMEQFYQISTSSDESSDEASDASSLSEEDSSSSAASEDGPRQSRKNGDNELKKQNLKKKKKKTNDEENDEDLDLSSLSPTPGKKNLEKKSSKKSAKRVRCEDDDDDDQSEPVTKKSKKGQKLESKQVSPDPSDDSEDNTDSEDSGGDYVESSESDESSDEEEMPEYTKEFELAETKVEHKWNELNRNAPAVSESTHRLAVCNMDWDYVRAQDLFVLFKSFATDGGSVRSVAIYPSEYGKARMAEEEMLGPREMRENLKKKEKEDLKKKEADEAAESKNKRNNWRRKRALDEEALRKVEKRIVKEEQEVLRDYQLNRLKYYYAVVDCSSVEVADNIYSECDGIEYQLSSVKLDLRFIPDDMTFDDNAPKESYSGTEDLVAYAPRLFNSTALSQGKVDVTWDQTDFDRLQKSLTHVAPKELLDIVENNTHAETIAPPESDSDSEGDGRPQWLKNVLADDDDSDEDVSEERKIRLYRKVLMDKVEEEKEKEERENNVDKEIEWQPGLKLAVAKKMKKKESEEIHGSIVDAYLEKKREKRRKKRKELKEAVAAEKERDGGDDEDMPDIIDEDLRRMMDSEGVDTSSANKKKKMKKKKAELVEENSEDERERAELALLVMDDGDQKSLDRSENVKKGRLTTRQKKKMALLERRRKKEVLDQVTVDVEDPRFSAMFSSHHFHIDPNAPEFKKTGNMRMLVDEQIKRTPKLDRKVTKKTMDAQEEEADSKEVSKKLLESLKKKMKKKK